MFSSVCPHCSPCLFSMSTCFVYLRIVQLFAHMWYIDIINVTYNYIIVIVVFFFSFSLIVFCEYVELELICTLLMTWDIKKCDIYETEYLQLSTSHHIRYICQLLMLLRRLSHTSKRMCPRKVWFLGQPKGMVNDHSPYTHRSAEHQKASCIHWSSAKWYVVFCYLSHNDPVCCLGYSFTTQTRARCI